MPNDMASVIVPKSDQLNADDLLAGPRTITITGVKVSPGGEQPVSVYFDGDDGKPWKPCKSMARVLVAAWGPDSSKYPGRSVTLYCDPTVKWGGMEVGGIRISHMTHIEAAMKMALTVTRGNKKPYTVQPLVLQDSPPGTAKTITAEQAAELRALCTTGGRDLTAELLERGELDRIEELPAKRFGGAKKWISEQRGLEFRGGADKPVDPLADFKKSLADATDTESLDYCRGLAKDLAPELQDEAIELIGKRAGEITVQED